MRAYYALDPHLKSLQGLVYPVKPHKYIIYYEQYPAWPDQMWDNDLWYNTSDGDLPFADISNSVPRFRIRWVGILQYTKHPQTGQFIGKCHHACFDLSLNSNYRIQTNTQLRSCLEMSIWLTYQGVSEISFRRYCCS